VSLRSPPSIFIPHQSNSPSVPAYSTCKLPSCTLQSTSLHSSKTARPAAHLHPPAAPHQSPQTNLPTSYPFVINPPPCLSCSKVTREHPPYPRGIHPYYRQYTHPSHTFLKNPNPKSKDLPITPPNHRFLISRTSPEQIPANNMYSCANYPRGCRGRSNTPGGRCGDCVVCSQSFLPKSTLDLHDQQIQSKSI
jgi:hypothetical protein